MGAPIITIGNKFSPIVAAPLVQLELARSQDPIVSSVSSILDSATVYPYSSIIPTLISGGLVGTAWHYSGVSVSGSSLLLTPTGYLTTNITTGVCAGTDYTVTLATTASDRQVGVTVNDVVLQPTLVLSGTTNIIQYKLSLSNSQPYIKLLIRSSANISIAGIEARCDELLYTNKSIGDDQFFYQYQALWHHRVSSAKRLDVIGPYGETIPASEYVVEYSATAYTDLPRYSPLRTWVDYMPEATCVVRILFKQRLVSAYKGKPLYLKYNKVPPASSANKEVIYGFRELIDSTGIDVLPFYSAAVTHVTATKWGGLSVEDSGYDMRSSRPKIGSALFFVPKSMASSTAFPHTTSDELFWHITEAANQGSHNSTGCTKISWQPVKLMGSNLIKVDALRVARNPYPDNRIKLLYDYDPDTGVYEPADMQNKSMADVDGTLLVYTTHSLNTSVIAGVDSNNGLIHCNEQLNGREAYISYLRPKSWWTFDRPYLVGPTGLKRDIDGSETADLPIIATIKLLPSYYALTNCSYTVDGDSVSIAATNLKYKDTAWLNRLALFGSGIGLKAVFLNNGILPSISILVTGATYSDSIITLSLASTPPNGYTLVLVPDLFEHIKLLYSYKDSSDDVVTKSAWYDSTVPTEFYTPENPYYDQAIVLGTYHVPDRVPGDYKLTKITVDGGGLLPDEFYGPGELQAMYPANNNFADIARWQGNPYQAESTVIVGVTSDWLAAYSTKVQAELGIANAQEYVLNKIKEVASKYCSYGAWVEVIVIPRTGILPLPWGQGSFMPDATDTSNDTDYSLVDMCIDFVPNSADTTTQPTDMQIYGLLKPLEP